MKTRDETCLYWYLAWAANGFLAHPTIRLSWADAKANKYVNSGTTFAFVSVSSLDGKVLFDVEDDPYRDEEIVQVTFDTKALMRGYETLDDDLRTQLEGAISHSAVQNFRRQ